MILVLKAKHGDYAVYARDKAERDRAYLYLFNIIYLLGYYSDLDGDQVTWCEDAKGGDARSARWLLDHRSDRGCEYETIEEIEPIVP